MTVTVNENVERLSSDRFKIITVLITIQNNNLNWRITQR